MGAFVLHPIDAAVLFALFVQFFRSSHLAGCFQVRIVLCLNKFGSLMISCRGMHVGLAFRRTYGVAMLVVVFRVAVV